MMHVGYTGRPGEHDISVFENGTVIRREFAAGRGRTATEVVPATVPELVRTIEAIIRDHSEELRSISGSLNSGSFDERIMEFGLGEI